MNSKRATYLWPFVSLVVITGCGRVATTPAQQPPISLPPPDYSIAIVPQQLDLAQGTSFTFSTTTLPNNAVSWAVQEGEVGGTIASDGIYTAPTRMGIFHVIATALLDPSKTSTATVRVPAVSVVVSPNTLTVRKGETRTFTSRTDSGLYNPIVQWTVAEGDTGGAITNSGSYTAPSSLGAFHVIATSSLDQSVWGIAAVTVTTVGFSPVGSIPTHGAAATATKLPNGKILIAGGTCACDPDFLVGTNSAELYDPATQTVAKTGDLLVARFRHTATLLKDGRVLIAGGFVAIPGLSATHDVQATKFAELYDPSTGKFSSTGAMNVARGAHTATLLPDGRVLITGGGTTGDSMYSDYGTAIRSAEIYDPATGTFSMAGDMSFPRYLQTATTLPDGQILIAGGASGTVWAYPTVAVLASDTTEIFDPSTGLFSQTASMHSSRAGHTATLLPNGNILIAGGLTDQMSAAAPSGLAGAAATPTAEIFDSTTHAFREVNAMSEPRAAHSAILLRSGMVLVAGGIDALSGFVSATAELFDPVSDTFSLTGGLATARDEHVSVPMDDGSALVIGGDTCGDDLTGACPDANLEVYR